MFSQGRFTPITLQELRHIETLQQIKFIDVQILRIIVQKNVVPIIWYMLTVITAVEIQGFNQSKLITLDFFLFVFSTKLRWKSLPTSWKLKVSIRQFGIGKLN